MKFEGLNPNPNTNMSELGVPTGSPDRLLIPDSRLSWGFADEYDIPRFDSPSMLSKSALELYSEPLDSKEIKANGGIPPRSIAFPDHEWTKDGIPLNPYGNTGLDGKVDNGKIGANQCVDVVAERRTTNGGREFIVIEKFGKLMFPGGHLDIQPFESLESYLNRVSIEETGRKELDEETHCELSDRATVLASGIFIPASHTSNQTWRETSIVYDLLDGSLADQVPIGDDDVEPGKAFWRTEKEIAANISPAHRRIFEFVLKNSVDNTLTRI